MANKLFVVDSDSVLQLETLPMPKVLPDRDIRKLLGTVILNADENRINPQGIEIRLGRTVLFQSTNEEKQLGPGKFLRVRPGESVLISSYETFVLTPQAIDAVFPGHDLFAFVTPTTTMMREGITQAATKVDSGWSGMLNWGLRNSSIKDVVLEFCEPIFKLTFFLLEGDEIPDAHYGERPSDFYQDTDGIARSKRKIPVDIPKGAFVESSVGRLDPKRELREAGYPFAHISTELTDLHGKWEVVSQDVRMMKEQFEERTGELRQKIEDETRHVSEKIEALFDRKFLTVAGAIVGCLSIAYAGLTFLRTHGVTGNALGWVALIAGFAALLVVYLLIRRKHDPQPTKGQGK